ncbi:uncharacterized protein LOC18442422 isoform X1 [Amborella trichopoda]|uniref:uncharacterized protein LOC18442422 isoform X1 n=1 Tax=Amborella trichopoda TaxID=13333 RepID=UPI0005D2EADE|nr:uncharacterized protein LOC18442422 isoform X1 [Amborella trichopoda]|eukprot:XP_011626437.1 uncharacterized protein LOC18442422 isoform X1 [Amborella trichopoda]
MAATNPRSQAISLLVAAKNHNDLAVKLSSLRQARDILISSDPTVAAELIPYVADLQDSPDSLVRKTLAELIGDLGLMVGERICMLVPVLVAFLKDNSPDVVKQTIVSGSKLFRNSLEDIALQFLKFGKVERWLEELWLWMMKFKDAVCDTALGPCTVATKLLAVKFLETLILLFTPEANDCQAPSPLELKEGRVRDFNMSWVVRGHPILDLAMLTQVANNSLGLLLDLLQSSNVQKLPTSLIIVLINCLAAVAKKRPLHYSRVLPALLGFDSDTCKGGHSVSIQHSLKTSFLGFLKCTHPVVLSSRDRLLVALRAINAGDVADQVVRQVDRMVKYAERTARDLRFGKDELLAGDPIRKRPLAPDDGADTNNDDIPAKRTRLDLLSSPDQPSQLINDQLPDSGLINGTSGPASLLGSEMTPVQQMIAMIGALLAEGERGAESLEILISKIHPDLLADIVMANMKYLPKGPPPLSTRLANSQAASPWPPGLASDLIPSSGPASSSLNSPSLDACASPSLLSDSKRDPRRDLRRLDPRRISTPSGTQLASMKTEDVSDVQTGSNGSGSLSTPPTSPVVTIDEERAEPLVDRVEPGSLDGAIASPIGNITAKEKLEPIHEDLEVEPVSELPSSSDLTVSSLSTNNETHHPKLDETEVDDGKDASCLKESDENSSAVPTTPTCEEIPHELPELPPIVILTEEQQESLTKTAVSRIIEAYRQVRLTGSSHIRLALLARLVAQTDANDDIVGMLQKHIIEDYQHQKGHELVMHVLYHLHSVMISEEGTDFSFDDSVYEKFLLIVAKALRDSLPASDKSLSRLLGEVPLLPASALKLLENLCQPDASDHQGNELRNGDRVTQGLGAVWSLILGRPLVRQVCLDIALKCAVHSQDDVRAKAIRLVANKLYHLSYVSDNIEHFATNMLFSVVDGEPVADGKSTYLDPNEQRLQTEETSASGSQSSAPDILDCVEKVARNVPVVSLSQAQCCMSLFFALCTKKPSLLQLVFDIYGRAPKAVKQAAHRHIPILLRTLGPSYSELLHIISNPPPGSENLLMLVLQILTEEMTPSPDLIATVKHLYATKLKDAAVLIPLLSLLSKDEVLPIFPRLVDLPLEKFQIALARILQGSAHTGPALTPAEVIIALHGIDPEKDGIALKKITEACSACFEQRTVFTQNVLAKALKQMVEQTPLPLLFMRTVIQAIGTFPALVDFVMGILSRLVGKQIWRMPKLWVGFLKCASQTQPHSFRVLLQLPSPQLENALNRYPMLRPPLAGHANQPSIRTSLSRSVLQVLGLVREPQAPSPSLSQVSTHTPDAGSSVQSTTLA